LGLLILLVGLINFTPVQNYIVQQVTKVLSKKLKTPVRIAHVRVDFRNHILLQGLYIEDEQKDTLIYAGELQVRMTDWFFIKKETPVIRYIGLIDANVHMIRKATSNRWNYDFIVDALSSKSKDTSSSGSLEIDLQKIKLNNVRFRMDDAWDGMNLGINVGYAQIDAHTDLKKKLIDISKAGIENALVTITSYKGGRPPIASKGIYAEIFDTTAFNGDKYKVLCGKLNLKECGFQYASSNTIPKQGEFDPEHIDISHINIDVEKTQIIGDTIKGHLVQLSAHERCGIQIKKMSSDISVSPIASVCKNLYLETNNSKIKNYYAMLYRHFPDFTAYIEKVVMVTQVQNSSIDVKDIAYFAPYLKQLPAIQLQVNGTGTGTVAKMEAHNLHVTDGSSTLKGNITLTGLPDIYKTNIDYEHGEIMTNGLAAIKYAPALKNNPNVAVEKILYAYYNGNFKGYLENFTAQGVIKTNLGIITADAALKIPFDKVETGSYKGYITATNLKLGELIRQDILGSFTCKANVTGVGFDAKKGAQLQLNAVIDRIGINGYDYQNVTANGLLAKKKFDGEMQVDDPNLALSFNGDIDFSQSLAHINAQAHLLKSDWKALGVIKDAISGDADFDLNVTGNDIDNFTGYAKLYNVDVKRNNHRLNIDSVYLQSDISAGVKNITIESNEITSHIRGNFELSKLGYSTQYYLSGYLPNYIKTPKKAAPDQNLTFDVATRNIDSLLGIISPSIRGFDDSYIDGSLNTIQQTLTLNVLVPYGSIGKVKLNNLNVQGEGNYSKLTLNAKVNKVIVGDSLLNIALTANTTIGNDSFHFNIITSTPNSYGTASINGEAYTHGDTLYMSLLPSDFYLGQNKWMIPSGNSIVYSSKYLNIKDLKLQSGSQQIAINTLDESTNQSINASIKDLEIAPIGELTGMGSFHPSGLVNGYAQIDHLFDKMIISTNIKGEDVKIDTDNFGSVFIVGNYNSERKELTFDNKTGIYFNSSSIRLQGNILFDSTSDQQINGNIFANHAPISWLSPLLTGYVSDLKGSVTGTINLNGTASQPVIDGSLSLNDAGVKMDVLGTYYTIPTAKFIFNEQRIDIANLNIYDAKKNKAEVTGYIGHRGLKDFALNLELTAPKMEVMKLKETDNKYFYGNVTAEVEHLTVKGPVDNIVLTVTGSAAEKSHIYIPISQVGGINSYNYVTFKSYKENTKNALLSKMRNKYKFTLNINANITPDVDITMILDPVSGDAINAKGNCSNLQMNMVLGGDFRMYGNYIIDEGDYTFSLKQLLGFNRKFSLNSGSQISFNGAMSQTHLAVNATYALRARLYDLLSDLDLKQGGLSESETRDAKNPQNVNVLLHMNGLLQKPELTFNIELPEKRSIGTYANTKLDRINQNDRDLLDEVGALLLVGTFIPPEGVTGTTNAAQTGAINNFSELLSTTASTQLTNIMNKLLGERNLSIELKYKNYSLSDVNNTSALNRNTVTVGISKKYLNDRLVLDLGSKYDWGKQSSSSSGTGNNFNLAGDFRVQYLLTEDGRLRLNAFHTSDYDVLYDQNITRNGVGISWRKSFNNFSEFIHSKNYQKNNQKKDTSVINK
jgi:TamB, inner membrane protein subunit of TAM complex